MNTINDEYQKREANINDENDYVKKITFLSFISISIQEWSMSSAQSFIPGSYYIHSFTELSMKLHENECLNSTRARTLKRRIREREREMNSIRPLWSHLMKDERWKCQKLMHTIKMKCSSACNALRSTIISVIWNDIQRFSLNK